MQPNNYHLRLLPHEIRGPTSFSALKRVDGVIHATFQSASNALCLLEDESDWEKTLEEAAKAQPPFGLRELFTIMLVFFHIFEPALLWEQRQPFRRYSTAG